jgi:hypothetical protein
VSSRTDAKSALDGSSSRCWFWLRSIIYACELHHLPACRAGAEGEEMSNGVPWSADDDQRIRDLARAGLSLGDIAIQMNRSISVIHRHAQRLRITIASDRVGLTSRLVELGLKAKIR